MRNLIAVAIGSLIVGVTLTALDAEPIGRATG